MQAMEEFPMPETYMQVHTLCGLVGHYWRFIKGFANIAHPLYDMLGKEVKMGPVDLPSEAREAVNILKGKVQSTPVLVFPDFDKPFLLETDASKALRKGWGRCSPRSRVTDITIKLLLEATPCPRQRRTTIAPSWSSSC